MYIFYSDLFLYTRILKTNVLTQFLSKKIPLELVSLFLNSQRLFLIKKNWY